MTDIKLLPLPEGVDVIFSPDGNGAALDVFIADQVEDYARANVAHATAAKDDEIEKLRDALEDLVRQTWHPSVSGWVDTRRSVAALRDHDQEVRSE